MLHGSRWLAALARRIVLVRRSGTSRRTGPRGARAHHADERGLRVLDEPTNHLDVENVEVLEDASDPRCRLARSTVAGDGGKFHP